MKNILKKVKLDTFFIFFIILTFITGMFKELLIFLSILIFHELGHIIASVYYGWNITQIKFYICGGYINYNEKLNKPIYQELIIATSGIIFQTIYFIIIYYIYKYGIISYNTFNLFKLYHFSILIFNSLPIYPLDGIKIINNLLCLILPYKISHKISIFISITFIIIFIIFSLYNFNLNYLMITSLLFVKIFNEIKYHNYYFNRFLFERYLYDFKFKKVKYIKNCDINKTYKDKKNYFIENNNYYSEILLLKNIFKV